MPERCGALQYNKPFCIIPEGRLTANAGKYAGGVYGVGNAGVITALYFRYKGRVFRKLG